MAQPLPSSGVLSIMQSFCNDAQSDSENLPIFNNSSFVSHFPNLSEKRNIFVLTSDPLGCSLYSFLSNLQRVAEDHNFFQPRFTPQDLDQLPEMYAEMVEDPVAVHDLFTRAQGQFS